MSKDAAQKLDFQSKYKLSVSEASLYLKVSPSTLRRLETEGKIASERLANGYRQYSISDLAGLKTALREKKELEKKKDAEVPQISPEVAKPTKSFSPENTEAYYHKPTVYSKINQVGADFSVSHLKTFKSLAYAGLALSSFLLLYTGAKFLGPSILGSKGYNPSLAELADRPVVLGEQSALKDYELK